MTVEQAISTLVNLPRISEDYDEVDMAIEALEKQIPKKPVKKNAGYFHEIILDTCPSCGCEYSMKDEHSYCPDCGQKLDWSNEE